MSVRYNEQNNHHTESSSIMMSMPSTDHQTAPGSASGLFSHVMYDRLMQLATQICVAQAALLILADGEQPIQGCYGLNPVRLLTVDQASLLNVQLPIVAPEPQLACDHPLLVALPEMRFCVCVPLVSTVGHLLGWICVLDQAVRSLPTPQREQLQNLAQHITELLEFQQSTFLHSAYVRALNQTTLQLLRQCQTQELLEAIVREACRLTGAPYGYLYLLNEQQTELTKQVSIGLEQLYGHRQAIKGEGVVGVAWEENRTVVVDDYHSWPTKLQDSPAQLSGVMAVPLRTARQMMGVIGMAFVEQGQRFNADQVELIERFAELAALTLEHARLLSTAHQAQIEQRRIERELHISRSYLRHLLDGASEMMHLTTVDGQLLYSNQPWRQRLGYDEAKLAMENVQQALHPLSVAAYQQALLQAQRDGYAPVQLQLLKRCGATIRVAGRLICHYEQSTPVMICAIFQYQLERRPRQRGRSRHHHKHQPR